MLSIYQIVMDPEVNPLRNLPPSTRYQTMVYLGLMWSTIFCAATGAWLYYGELIIGHSLVALGFAVTGWTFSSASRYRQPVRATYRDHPREDGTARYDDVWGA